MNKSVFRIFSYILVLGMLVSMASPAQATTPGLNQTILKSETTQLDSLVDGDDWLQKLHPDLRELVKNSTRTLTLDGSKAVSDENSVMVQVMFSLAEGESAPDISSYFVDGKALVRRPFGKDDQYTQMVFGNTQPSLLQKIATVSNVSQIIPVVLEQNAYPEDYPIDDPREEPDVTPEDWANLRLSSQDLKEKTVDWADAKVFGDGVDYPIAKDWFEVSIQGPHKAEAAWDRGFTGEGVTVAVIDDGIDIAHPDLMGTQKLITDPNSLYAGWPMVFSPISQLLAAYDYFLGYSYIADGYPGAHYVDTSEIADLSTCGVGLVCFDFTPLIDYGYLGYEHTYIMETNMSLSGEVHVGTHPDVDLRDYVWGEKPALIVVDPNEAGVYDTVIIDLNDNYDFTDDKPLTKADLGDLENTYNNMVSYIDLNLDGLADLSGGMLYYISDGVTPLPVSDWLWGSLNYAPGDFIAISGSTFDRSYSHGTQCASNIVGQGVARGRLPQFDLNDDGTLETLPTGAVYGMAPEAKVVTVADVYINFDSSKYDAYLFSAVGYDGIDQTGWHMVENEPGYDDTDALQVTSNSYGASDDYGDGWEYDGQWVSVIQNYYAPNLQFTFSTGNGGPGFGTSSPPSPETAIAVGASTEYGSTGWDSIKDPDQITFNDVTPFSNRGPGAREGAGVDVVAGGAYAAGDEELNYYSISSWGWPDGNVSWDSWGGTSRSAPVAAGVLALIYDAYEETNGYWPYFDEAQSLLMSSATDVNYDVYTQGAGSVNADRGTLLASGEYGVYTYPFAWVPGDYQGEDFPAFAHLVYPDMTYTETVDVYNPSSDPITVDIETGRWEQTGSDTFDFSITQEMIDNTPLDTFYSSPQWIIPMTVALGSTDIEIPLDTDLMVVRMVYDYDTFDIGKNYAADTRYRLMVYDWKDQDDDGLVWDDLDGDGNVDFVEDPSIEFIDPGNYALDCSDPTNEIDCYEFARFGYNRPTGNVSEMWVQTPLDRMHDGLFIGLQQYAAYSNPTEIMFEVDYYKFVDHPYLSTSDTSLMIPAGGMETFDAIMEIPADIETGFYEAAIKISDPGNLAYDSHITVIPVTINVASEFEPGMKLGGDSARIADENLLYNNGQVRGYFDWGWREESGDWRFYYVDVPEEEVPAGNAQFLIKDTWEGYADPLLDETSVAMNDIDTWVYGPYPPNFSIPSYFGPYTLGLVGNSQDMRSGRAVWNFNTATGDTEDWIAAPLQEGLHEILQHNVLFQGDQFSIGFEKEVGTVTSSPEAYDITVYQQEGKVGSVTMASSFAFDEISAQAFGLGGDELTEDIPLSEAANGNDYVEFFEVNNGAKITIETSSSISDVDLYLYYCGLTGTSCVQRGSSESSGSSESITVLMPEDGIWAVEVFNYSGEAGTFDLYKNIVQGNDLTVTNIEQDPDTFEFTFDVMYEKEMEPGDSYSGLVLFGPDVAPSLLELNITITYQDPVAGIEVDVDKPTVFPTDDLSYTITLHNTGDPAAEFDFTADLPEGVTFDSVVSDIGVIYNVLENRIECLDCSIPVDDAPDWGSEVVLDVVVDNDVVGGQLLTLIGMLSTMHADMQPEPDVQDSATSVVQASNLTTSFKSADLEFANPGDTITYEIVVENTGSAPELVEMVDYLSDDVIFGELISPFGGVAYDSVDHKLTWTGTIPVDGDVTIVYTVIVDSGLSGWGVTIENTASITYRDGGMIMELDADPIPVMTGRYYFPLITK